MTARLPRAALASPDSLRRIRFRASIGRPGAPGQSSHLELQRCRTARTIGLTSSLRYAACKSGQRESPINIVGAQPAELAPIQFDYTLAPLKIINNGFTIQINYEPGSSITVNGIALPLVQFHFHHASENEINGQKYDMELHFVHMDSAANRAAVVAVFIKSGAENAPLRDLWRYIPRDKGKEEEHKKVVINPADLLPADQNYYLFDGSLHHSSLQGGRQVVRHENSHRSLSRADRGVCKILSGQCSPASAGEWQRDSRKQLPSMRNLVLQ